VQPHRDGDLSRWMQWLTTAHMRRYHRHYHGIGHVWQDRYKSFPIQADDHLYMVLRYIERNPLRANLVEPAWDWSWSSLRWWQRKDRPGYLSDGRFYAGVGEFDEAERYARAALDMRRRLHGSRHPQTAFALHHLALALDGLGKSHEAAAAREEEKQIYASMESAQP
jgi:hypothetical protein